MKIRGQLVFSGFQRQHNQVTLSGANAIAQALAANTPIGITNILYITDPAGLDDISSYVDGNYRNLSFKNLFFKDAYGQPNLARPAFNQQVYAGAADAAFNGKGRIDLSVLPPTDSEVQLACNIKYDAGSWPSLYDKTPIKAMALILNGNPQLPMAFDGSAANLYHTTGNEILLAFIPIEAYLVYLSSTDNEFAWNIYIGVR